MIMLKKVILSEQLNPCEFNTGVSRIVCKLTKLQTVVWTVFHIALHKCATCKTKISF